MDERVDSLRGDLAGWGAPVFPVAETAQAVGYRQSAQFAKAFRRYHHVAPTALAAHAARTAPPPRDRTATRETPPRRTGGRKIGTQGRVRRGSPSIEQSPTIGRASQPERPDRPSIGSAGDRFVASARASRRSTTERSRSSGRESSGPFGCRSPQRSHAAGVDPSASRVAPVVSDGEETSARWDVHPLAAVALLIRPCLGPVAEESEHLIVVSDASGLLLWVEGRPRTRLDAADAINFTEGAGWGEQDVGTNAVGTALAVDHAVQVRRRALRRGRPAVDLRRGAGPRPRYRRPARRHRPDRPDGNRGRRHSLNRPTPPRAQSVAVLDRVRRGRLPPPTRRGSPARPARPQVAHEVVALPTSSPAPTSSTLRPSCNASGPGRGLLPQNATAAVHRSGRVSGNR